MFAVLGRGSADRRRVRTTAGLGNRHGRPAALEALQLLFVGHRCDRRIAQALARHGQQQADIAPAQLHDPQQRRQVAAILVARSLLSRGATLARRGRANRIRRAGVHPVQQRGEQVELLRIGVFGLVVFARDRPKIIGRHLMGLGHQATEFLWSFQIHQSRPL